MLKASQNTYGNRAATGGNVAREEPADTLVFLSTDVASPRVIKTALAAVFVSTAIFAAATPFAQLNIGPMPAFLPIYASTLVICDVMTAVLLFSQFYYLGSRALFLLGAGYAFTAAITVAYSAVSPGLLTPNGLLGAGPQSTTAIYVLWHASFPLIMIGYTLVKSWEAKRPGHMIWPRINPAAAILGSIALALAIVTAYAIFATLGQDWLRVIAQYDRAADFARVYISIDWSLNLLALIFLWRQRRRTVIDMWLIAVMSTWLFDIAMSAILNTGRYDLGWYLGHVYGLLAASFLLVVLLTENSKYYARLVLTAERLKSANLALQRLSHVDGLTNVANRRHFDSYLIAQIGVAQRYEQNLALILWDVDAFKAYNDHYGHQAGDECLKQIVGALTTCCRRPMDVVARFGGEEFAMILPDTDLAGARHVAQAAQAALAALAIPHEFSPASNAVTMSGGIAVMSGKTDAKGTEIILAADHGLYEAKKLGRNRVVCLQLDAGAESAPPEPALVP